MHATSASSILTYPHSLTTKECESAIFEKIQPRTAGCVSNTSNGLDLPSHHHPHRQSAQCRGSSMAFCCVSRSYCRNIYTNYAECESTIFEKIQPRTAGCISKTSHGLDLPSAIIRVDRAPCRGSFMAFCCQPRCQYLLFLTAVPTSSGCHYFSVELDYLLYPALNAFFI